ncbi:MAG: PLP-dependent aminotransferase family protein [Proteobacteria bacterium]|nr:PLP-dependent aminotransferase family protein [Pseudomonadota bacterium]
MPGWADLYAWQVERDNGTPLFRQIYLQVRSAILSRTFPPGTKLPSTRALAQLLSVARASVVAAYEQLFAEGYLLGKIGAGTYISADLPEPVELPRRLSRPTAPRRPAPRPVRDFSEFGDEAAQTDVRPFNPARLLVDARTVEVWRKLSNHALREFDARHLGYSDPRGFIELRTVICEYLRAARAVRCDPEQIIVTSGTQQAIDIAIRVLLDRDDEVWVEDPGYPLTHRALAAAGATVRFIPVDAQGVVVAAGIKAAPRARAAFVTPSHQYPTGVVLSMARRIELLAWARKTGAWIIEDDYASEFRYSGRPLASLQGLDDGERVLYFGTLNKALLPGLRIGYAVLPRPLLRSFVNARCLIDRQPPSLDQMVVAEFMRQGHLASHIRRMRLRYREQRDTLAAELTRRAGHRLAVELPDQGMHLVAYLADGQSDIAIEDAARRNGVVVRPMSRLYKTVRPRSALMLGFAGFPRPLIIPAAARLAEVLEQASRPGRRRALRRARS